MTPVQQIEQFVKRLNKIGISIQIMINHPWVYLTHVNNEYVTEKLAGKHGFTIAFMPIKPEDLKIKWQDLTLVFYIIRKYTH